MALTVGLMYNLGKNDPPAEGEPPDANAEFDSETTVVAIAGAIAAAGHSVVRIEGDEDAYGHLRRIRPDIVFNICEGRRGGSRESQIPAILEMLGIPYTGSGILPMAVSLDKAAAKKMFQYHGVSTPAFRAFAPGDPVEWTGLRFPLFVKPANEGSSMGIAPQSKVNTPVELTERVLYIHQAYRQTALVEEFIDGREFTVGMVGNGQMTIFPIMEILFDQVPSEHGNIYSYHFKQKWGEDWSYYRCPAALDEPMESAIKQAAVGAVRALGVCDVARVDLRLGPDGVPYVLEVNPLPGLSPGYSDMVRQAERGGWSYNDLVQGILQTALARYRAAQTAPGGFAETAD